MGWKRIGAIVFASVSMAALAAFHFRKNLPFNLQNSKQFRGALSESPFARLEKKPTSEVYLKNARAFIFTQILENQELRLRDSVFVGPSSEAILVLADELGGGRILLAANTVITLSSAGKKNEIPTLDIKQGEIKIVEAPKPKPRVKKKKPSSGVSKGSAPAAAEPPDEEVVPTLLITSGTQAVVFDETLAKTDLKVGDTQNIEFVGEKNKATPTVIALLEVQEIKSEVADLAVALSTITAETKERVEAEAVARQEELERDRVPASLALEDLLEPVTSPEPVIAKPNPPAAPPVPAPVEIAETPRSLLFDRPEEVAKKKNFEAAIKVAQRSSKDESRSGKTIDTDIQVATERRLSEKLSVAAQAEITVSTVKKPANVPKAPRPLRLGLELKYYLFADPQRRWLLSLVGGYSFQHTLGSTTLAAYQNIYAPLFGFDSMLRLSGGGYVLLAPRASWIAAGTYSYSIPLTYYWTENGGAVLSYSSLKLSPGEGLESADFSALAAGIVYKF